MLRCSTWCLSLSRCCFRRCREHRRSTDNINAWTLSFHDPGIEAGFLRSRRRELTRNGFAIALAALVMSVAMIANIWKDKLSSVSSDELETKFIKTILLSFQISLSIFGMAYLKMPGWDKSDFALETGVSVIITIGLPLAVAVDAWYLCKLLGKAVPPGVVRSDSKVLLLLDGAITMTHLTLPIRWPALLPMEILAMSLYAACILVGSSESDALFNWVMLFLLVFFTAIGKRTLEYYERLAFCNLLQEKQLRFQTEFQLEKIGKTAVPKVLDKDQFEVSTNGTARIFDTADAASSQLTSQLAEIATIGRKEQWLVDPAELRVLRHCILGSGGFGIVISGFLCEAPVAIKLSKRLDSFCSGKGIIDISNEVRVLRRLRHPNIVLFHGAYVDVEKWNIALVLEKVCGSLLSKYVHPHNTFGGKACLEGVAINRQSQHGLALGICQALLYLHTRKPSIVHGDLKPGNIVVECCSSVLRPKLLDFGLSRVLGNGAKVLGHTQAWAAPEILLHPDDPACVSADIFSFGCILYFLSTGRKPREGQPHRKNIKASRKGEPLQLFWVLKCEFMQACKPLVNDCVQHLCSMRPSIQDACKRLMWRREDFAEESRGEPLSAEVLSYVRQQSIQQKLSHVQDPGFQPQVDNVTSVEVERSLVKHIEGQDTHEDLNAAPALLWTSTDLPETLPPVLPQEPPGDVQSAWLGAIILDCEVQANVPVHACSVYNLTPMKMPSVLFFTPPACLASCMTDETLYMIMLLMQGFVNETLHGIPCQNRSARVVLTSVFRTCDGTLYPVIAHAECSSCLPCESREDGSTESRNDTGLGTRVRIVLTNVSFAASQSRLSRQRSVTKSSLLTPIAEGKSTSMVAL